jgi:Nif-specific regulatory protein
VLILAEHFLKDFCQKARRKVPKFSAEARKRIMQHTWPGNVRELRNLMERLAYLTQGDTVEMQDLGFILTPANEAPAWVASDQPLSEATDQFQTEYIKKAIARTKGNMSEAAERLGLHRSNLYRKMRQLGMAVE